MINETFLNHLKPVELEFIQAFIYKLTSDKITLDTTNSENIESTVSRCPHCGSFHFVKNGFNKKHRQKYLCRNCGKIFSDTTNTIFSHTRSHYHTWTTFIACELNQMTLEQEVVATGKSKTTCFHMRHKLYAAIGAHIRNTPLKGIVKIDSTFTGINLKGMKAKNMPRISKVRGKSKTDTNRKHKRGINSHKVCIVTAIDEWDTMLFEIAGNGAESTEKYQKYIERFDEDCTIVSDGKQAILEFASNNQFQKDTIRPKPNQKNYASQNGNNLGEVNQMHQEFKQMIKHYHGVSIRHLQHYLDWLVFRKQMKYQIRAEARKTKAYMLAMKGSVPFVTKDICSFELPIDVFTLYQN